MDSNHSLTEENTAADDIAAEITKILVKAFTAKEGRAPSAEEVEQLIEELTEERIESMLGGLGDTDEVDDEKTAESESEDEGDVEKDVDDEPEENPAVESSTGNKRSLDETVQKNEISANVSVDLNEVKKPKVSCVDTDA